MCLCTPPCFCAVFFYGDKLCDLFFNFLDIETLIRCSLLGKSAQRGANSVFKGRPYLEKVKHENGRAAVPEGVTVETRQIVSNFNGSNSFGTTKISSRQG